MPAAVKRSSACCYRQDQLGLFRSAVNSNHHRLARNPKAGRPEITHVVDIHEESRVFPWIEACEIIIEEWVRGPSFHAIHTWTSGHRAGGRWQGFTHIIDETGGPKRKQDPRNLQSPRLIREVDIGIGVIT